MKEGHDYQVRVSNNRNLSPMGSTTFTVIKDKQTPIMLFPIPLPVRQPEDALVKSLIKKLKFVTQMDSRVCPICERLSLESSPGFQAGEYDPDLPIPRIPVHFNCRCTYDVIFNEEFEKEFVAVQQIYLAAQAAIQHDQTITNHMNILKAIAAIEMMTK